jgi:hypothetical protein
LLLYYIYIYIYIERERERGIYSMYILYYIYSIYTIGVELVILRKVIIYRYLSIKKCKKNIVCLLVVSYVVWTIGINIE